MSEQLDLPQTEALLRAHYAQTDPAGLRPDSAARIRRDLEQARSSGRTGAGLLRLEPVRGTSAHARLTPGWSLAAAAVVAILVLTWIAMGRLSSEPVAGSPSAAVSAPSAPAVASGRIAGGSPGHSAPGGSVAPSPSAAGSDQRAIAFSDRQHGIVVGSYQGQGAIWTTADEGQTWTSQLVSTPPLDSVAVLGTKAWASATCTPEQNCTPAFLSSTDSGATWSVTGPWPVASITFGSATHGFGTAVGSDALLESTDGGRTWSPYATPCEAHYVLVGVSFADAQHGWAACDSGGAMGSSNKEVLATDDAGVTWHTRARVRMDQTQSLGQIPAYGTLRGIQMLASGTGIAWLWNEGVIRTTDGGVTWTRLPLGDAGGDLQWPGAAIASDGSLFALTVNVPAGDISATFNLGLSDGRDWKPYTEFGALPAPGTTPTPEPTSPPQPAIADSGVGFFDADHGIAIGNDATHSYLWRTADGGKHWTAAPLGKAHASLSAVFGDRAWITTTACPVGAQAGDPGCTATIERSDDRGATWTVVSHRYLSSMSFGDAAHGFGVGPYVKPTGGDTIGGSGTGVYMTTDGGATWAPLPTPRPCLFDPVSVSFVSATHGWLGCGGQGGAGSAEKGVLETNDGGATWAWRSRTGIGTSAIGSITTFDYLGTIAMQPDGAGFITGGRFSTLRTADGGRTWLTSPPGEFDAYPTSQATMVRGGPWFVIQNGWITPGSTVMQARLMRSDDQGATWTQVGSVLPNP